MWSIAAPLVMRMCGYTVGVATTCYYPYPAVAAPLAMCICNSVRGVATVRIYPYPAPDLLCISCILIKESETTFEFNAELQFRPT